MKLIGLIAILIYTFQLKAQTHDSRAIIEKADSILLASVGEHLYEFYSYDTDSYYEYVKKNGKTSWETLYKKKLTKGEFANTNVRFNFRHPDYYWLIGYTGVSFDKNLKLTDSLNINFIPEFVKNNMPCDFISASEALKIAKLEIERNGINALTFYLSFDLGKEIYVWTVADALNEGTETEESDILSESSVSFCFNSLVFRNIHSNTLL